MLVVVCVILGLILGSFLSVLVERLDRKEGIVTGRSACPHCDHVLSWYELIPVLSWVFLRGRCHACHARISLWYPVREITLAVVLGLYVYRWGIPSTWYAIDLVILFGLVALFFFDLRWQVLPDVVVLSLGVIVVLRLLLQRSDLLVNHLATGVLLCGLVALLHLGSRGRLIGFGDVKLAFVIGALFGYPAAIGVTLSAIWAGAIVGVALMVSRRASMQTALPFGSFWAAVAVVALIFPGPVYFLAGLLTPHV